MVKHFLYLLVVICVSFGPSAFGQGKNATPTILKGPADWRFERLPIPPGFAPDVKWNGFEEARFAPGMFDPSSANYFSYALVVSVEGTNPVEKADVQDFLDKYIKGLSVGVGRRKGLTPDASQLGATVTALKSESGSPAKFEAIVPFFDTFNDGRKIILNLRITVIPRADEKRTFVVLLISPKPTDAEIWKTLRSIGEEVGTK